MTTLRIETPAWALPLLEPARYKGAHGGRGSGKSHTFAEMLIEAHIMDQTSGFASFYQNMFGDPWARADSIGPIFPPAIRQPEMALPFEL